MKTAISRENDQITTKNRVTRASKRNFKDNATTGGNGLFLLHDLRLRNTQ